MTARPFTDLGNAERLTDSCGDRIRYVPAWNNWLIWDGQRWAQDNLGQMWQLAAQVVRDMYTEVGNLPSDSQRKQGREWLTRSESESRLRSMINLAGRAIEGTAIDVGQLDQHPWLLNCANGIVDLKTGALQPHDPDHMLTQMVPFNYDPAAQCPLWDATLLRLFGGDEDMVRFFQRAVGYTITGVTTEQVLFIAWGTGANGKSTVVETLRYVLSDFGQQVPTETLLENDKRGASNDVARLRGVRMAVCTETPEGRRLAENTVKQLTGGDTIVARQLYQDFVEFSPCFTPWMITNHRPIVRGTDAGIWRRLLLVPFTVTIPEGERDGELPNKLQNEAEGILRWAVEGCLEWQKSKLQPPQSVTDATEGYRSEQDSLGEFLAGALVKSPGSWVGSTELYQRYTAWVDEAGERPLSQKSLSMRMTDRGYEKGRHPTTRRSGWVEVKLTPVTSSVISGDPFF